MFSRQLNQIKIDISVTPRGPLLIRSGRKGADPSRPDLECVRTSIAGRPSVYLPGSSLKGVMRSHAERLLTSENVAITPTFSMEGAQAFRQNVDGETAYSKTCPLGRTFGNLHVKGHISVTDAVPGGHAVPGSEEHLRELDAANNTEQRNGVGIDRLLGSAKRGALFDQEVVVDGRFDGSILMRNVQLYQLTLVLLVLRDLDEGWVQLGSGTSRGNGQVKVDIRRVRIETRAGKTPAGKLVGVGALGDQLKPYELFRDDVIEFARPGKRKMVWDVLDVTTEEIDALGEALVDGPWTSFLEQTRSKKWAA